MPGVREARKNTQVEMSEKSNSQKKRIAADFEYFVAGING